MKYEPFSTLQPSNSHAKSKVKTLYLNLLAYIHFTYNSQTYILISHVSFLELRKIEPYGMNQWWQKILPTSKIKVDILKKGQIKAASSLVFPSHSAAIDFFFFWTPKSKVSKVVVASLVLCIGTQSSCKISIDEAENVFGKIRPKSSKTAQKRAKWNCRDLITSHSSLSTKELSCVKMNLLWFFFSRVWFYMYVHKSGQILQYLSNHIPIQ